MKILTVSDRVDEMLYSPALKRCFSDVDLILGCGDLPYYYLEYLVTVLGGPLFYVNGNHGLAIRNRQGEEWANPGGCENIDGRVVHHRGLLIAGLEGSMRYNDEPYFQYTEREMAQKVLKLVPSLMVNKLVHGRFLDILITHAPPHGLHDQPDLCHRGFRAFVTLMDRFRPRYLIHGHVHLYKPTQPVQTPYRDTTVINTYGYRTITMDEPMPRKPSP